MKDLSEKETPPGIGRVEAFSDGVIAFAITLMVLELIDPALAFFNDGNFSHISPMLGEPLLVYILSFVMIAIMLVNHQDLMHRAPHATPTLFWLNMHLLFWITLVPVSTAALGAHLFQPIAAAFYGAVLTGSALAFTLLHRCVAVLRAGGGTVSILRSPLLHSNLIATVLYGVSIPLAFVSPYLSLAIFVIIPCAYFLPRYDVERPTKTDSR
jgi:uncharacterized membrane protein